MKDIRFEYQKESEENQDIRRLPLDIKCTSKFKVVTPQIEFAIKNVPPIMLSKET